MGNICSKESRLKNNINLNNGQKLIINIENQRFSINRIPFGIVNNKEINSYQNNGKTLVYIDDIIEFN